MYDIKKYSFDKAKEFGVKIKPSTKGFYKIDVFDKDDKYLCSIGDRRYSDYPTYIETKGQEIADIRRSLYNKRHKKDNGIKGFYAKNLLW